MMSKAKRTDLADFYEEVGSKYDEERVVYRDLRGKLRKKFVQSYLKLVDGYFLDLGCNTGMYLDHFDGRLGIGIDISTSVLRKAKKRCQNQVKTTQYDFIAGDIENLQFIRKIKFDFILCSEVLEHLFNPQSVLNEITRLLKPGGRALITTPNYKNNKPKWVSLEGFHGTVSGEQYYHTAYRPEELKNMAEKSNLKIQDVGTLEWEVKYAAKIPVLVLLFGRFLNHSLFRSKKMDALNQRLFEISTLFWYYIGHGTGLKRLLHLFIHEGVRSYILVTRES